MEKKQNFIGFFTIPIIWKSDHWSLCYVLINKSGQNEEKSGKWLFSNYFQDLLSENGLKPNMIPHINVSEVWNAFITHICDFDNHVWFCRHLKGHRSHQNGNFSVTFDLFETIPSLMVLKILHMWYKYIP